MHMEEWRDRARSLPDLYYAEQTLCKSVYGVRIPILTFTSTSTEPTSNGTQNSVQPNYTTSQFNHFSSASSVNFSSNFQQSCLPKSITISSFQFSIKLVYHNFQHLKTNIANIVLLQENLILSFLLVFTLVNLMLVGL